jgi:hypothetical protein
MSVSKMKMSGDWQTGKGSIADLGFVPTKKEIVLMEMSKIDFSELDQTPLTMCDFTGGEGSQLFWMHEYCKQQGLNPYAYYNEMHSTRFETAKKSYNEVENFNFMNTDFFYLKCRHKNGNAYKKDNIAVIRNNPPYTFLEVHGQTIRAEDLFFMDNSVYNAPGGIHIFELPIHQLIGIDNLLKKILYRYENVHIFKFPEKDFKMYKQVALIGVRKKQSFAEAEKAEWLKEKLIKQDIPYLDEDNSPVVKLSQKCLNSCKPINVYRDGRVNDITLTNGYADVISSVWDKVRKSSSKNLITIEEKGNPIIEKLLGHKALELNSGVYNGIQDDKVLIKGGYEKEVIVVDEWDGDTKITTRTEIIKPTIAVTNKSGDILVKGQI